MNAAPQKLAGYGHFLAVSQRQAWDAEEIDLAPDRRGWPCLEARERASVARLVAGFCLGEAAVAGVLEPFADAASDAETRACFLAQAAEEERHARFFDRVAAEVLGVDGSGPAERRKSLRALLHPSFLALFEEGLPAAATALREDSRTLPDAVGLYHLILEGVVFATGQEALLGLLDGTGIGRRLPGLREGAGLVARDERWHIGFGARCLQDVGAPPELLARIAAQGREAADAWGTALDPGLREQARAVHDRRLGAAGLDAGATEPVG